MSLFDRRRRDADSGARDPSQGAPDAPAAREPASAAGAEGAAASSPPVRERSKPNQSTTIVGGKMANIGKSITLKGDLSGNEDLVIEGHIEGRVDLPNNELTIGANGSVSAEIHAKTVVVVGKVTGNVSATERIEVQATGLVNGDVSAPRLIVQEGAVVNGSIEMGNKAKASQASAGLAAAPAPQPIAEKKAMP